MTPLMLTKERTSCARATSCYIVAGRELETQVSQAGIEIRQNVSLREQHRLAQTFRGDSVTHRILGESPAASLGSIYEPGDVQ